MKTTDIKEKLHQYIETADEKKLKAIYTMVEEDIARMRYEVQKNDLGKRFELSVEIIIKKIQATPEFFKYAKRPFREASVIK
jgi:hypothetical protein